MPRTREEKKQLVAELAETFRQAGGAIMTDFRGLSVSQMEELRDLLHKADSRYMVVKNTLAKLAMEQAGLTFEPELYDGPTAVAFAREDLVATAKAISQFAKDAPTFGVRGGLMNGERLTAAEVERLAQLPGLDELRARLVGQLAAPLYGLVGALSGSQRGLVQVLRARAQEMQEAA